MPPKSELFEKDKPDFIQDIRENLREIKSRPHKELKDYTAVLCHGMDYLVEEYNFSPDEAQQKMAESLIDQGNFSFNFTPQQKNCVDEHYAKIGSLIRQFNNKAISEEEFHGSIFRFGFDFSEKLQKAGMTKDKAEEVIYPFTNKVYEMLGMNYRLASIEIEQGQLTAPLAQHTQVHGNGRNGPNA